MKYIVVLLIIAYAAFLCIKEIPDMLKKKEFKELATFSVILTIASVFGILHSFDVKVPNPNDLIAWIYRPISDALKVFME